tara:strand:- start:896 stop:3679 length:2784 start_codon:yes stop_codon:yes gene_type:complete
MPDIPMQQRVRVLSNGISKQAPTVRYPNQVADAENVQFSILKGASKRAGSDAWIRMQSGSINVGGVYRLHMIERDDQEQYAVVYGDSGFLQCIDLNTKRVCTTTMKGSASTYLSLGSPDAEDFRFLTVGDTTFVCNTKVATGMIDDNTIDYSVMPHRLYRDTLVDGVATFKVTPVPWSERNYFEQFIKANDTNGGYWKLKFRGETTRAFEHPADTGYDYEGMFYHIHHDAQASHYVSGESGDGVDQYLEQLSTIGAGKTICTFGPLNDTTYHDGMLIEFSRDIDINDGGVTLNAGETAPLSALSVGGDDRLKFVQDSLVNGATSKTYEIVRGSNDRNPPPEPIANNEVIKDMAFYRGRLVLAFPSTLLMSRTNATYDFWIQKPASIADTDPITLRIASDDVANVVYIVPFRGSLMILTAQGRQYFLEDVTTLSPSTASIAPTTRYETSDVKPASLGDSIYMMGSSLTFSPVYQYFYDDMGGTSRAVDVSKHVQGLVPTDIGGFTGSAASQTLCCVSKVSPVSNTARSIETDSDAASEKNWGDYTAWTFSDSGSPLETSDLGPQPYDTVDIKSGHTIDLDSGHSGTNVNGYDIPPPSAISTAELYNYRWYDEGNERIQSAWTKWTYGLENLLDASVLDDALYMLRRVDDTSTGDPELYVDRIFLGDETPTHSDYGFNVKLDYKIYGLVSATGDHPTTSSYVGGLGTFTTTYDLKFPDQDGTPDLLINQNINTAVLSNDFVMVDVDSDSYVEADGFDGTGQPTKSAKGQPLVVNQSSPATTSVEVRFASQTDVLQHVRLASAPTISLNTNLTGGNVILGSKYTSYVTLTKAMMRDQSNNPLLEGKLSLDKIKVDHMDSGSYDIIVTPDNSNIAALTIPSLHIGVETYGHFEKVVTCNADTTTFKLQSTGVEPCSWTSYEWHGRYATSKG